MKTALFIIASFGLSILPVSAADNEHPATLKQYDAVRAALASDDLSAAKKAAAELVAAAKKETATAIVDESAKLSESKSLNDARKSFQAISVEIEKWVKGKPGFFVMTCPMVPASVWIQTTDKIGNPYKGKEMQECGEIKN